MVEIVRYVSENDVEPVTRPMPYEEALKLLKAFLTEDEGGDYDLVSTETGRLGDRMSEQGWRSKKIRRPRAVVEPWVQWIEGQLADQEVYVCGSWRRGRQMIGDLDVLLVTEDGHLPDDVIDTVLENVHFERGGPAMANGNIVLADGDLHVDIYACTPQQRGAFLWFLTGPMDLNIHMRALAMRQGRMLNQYGLWRPVPWEVKRLADKSGWVIQPAHDVADETQQEVLTPTCFRIRREAQEWIDNSLVPHLGQMQIDNGSELSIARHLDCLHVLEPSRREVWQAVKGPATTTQRVPSSDGKRVYTVTIHGPRVSCSCPGFHYRRKCRHIEGKGTPSAW